MESKLFFTDSFRNTVSRLEPCPHLETPAYIPASRPEAFCGRKASMLTMTPSYQ